MIVIVIMTAVCPALGLERSIDCPENGAEFVKHILDHMVRTNTKAVVSNVGRQMTIAEMPCKAYKLATIVVRNLDNRFRGRLNHEPPPIIKLHTVPICHGDSFRKIEEDILSLIRCEPNPAPVPGIEIERDSACGIFLRPMPGRTMS
ncbi:MAG TPA: hypothetical protein VK752_16780 [Bryobacteraceae bacterium]|nr:hypothetical protein [Bryobacteraceae bacterium]